MADHYTGPSDLRLSSPSGLRVQLNSNGSLRRLDYDPVSLLLFVGNELDGGPANLYLRGRGQQSGWTALLGPRSPTRFRADSSGGSLIGTGAWQGIDYCIALVLAKSSPTWFWHVQLHNTNSIDQQMDLTYTQDLALAPYGAIRLNEFYVSQYLDHTPLQLPGHGLGLATRQNQAVDGRYPWCLIGSLGEATSFATDALQFNGLSARDGSAPIGMSGELPSARLQHEHALVCLRDAAIRLAPGQRVNAGFFGAFVPDHRQATSEQDTAYAREVLQLAEAAAPALTPTAAAQPGSATLFSTAPLLSAHDLQRPELQQLFGAQWRHEETDDARQLLSFFHGRDSHVVLRRKELSVLRPHGHLLRSGRNLTPDETALTSTAWMGGVFHSMVTEGHVSINRFLSTVHSYLGLFRSHGLRVFAEIDGRWHLLQSPSAFEMSANRCRWIYRHAAGEIQVVSTANSDPHELTLSLQVTAGAPARFLISMHVALNDDDGSTPGAISCRRSGDELTLDTLPDTDLGRRFPQGSFRVRGIDGTRFEAVTGDELLFVDGQSRNQPFVCLVTTAGRQADLSISGNLVATAMPAPLLAESAEAVIPTLVLQTATANRQSQQLQQLAEIVPWFAQNALIHYLAPRGLEQYSGGGWGTRDVCQGPVELLLALGRTEPIRDLLSRVMSTQNPDGDWPQWFMFFDRERDIRAGDSHGDIVFWPLVVLAQYLTACGDAAFLDEVLPFFDPRGDSHAERASVWEHVKRALTVTQKRVIPGTALAAYGHGDWNDSLQPADPALREKMCSAWTVTLDFQTLTSLAAALRGVGRAADATGLEQRAQAVKADFQRLLVVNNVLTGYAIFEAGKTPRYLLHPNDESTSVHYSSLAMIHAILEDLFTPEQARAHLDLIDSYLSTADGVRLFDRPMPYYGGLQRLFQRAETATYFGREIGLMYTHAHLRYAQALAHVGHAERFLHALSQANPIAISTIVPTATLRQANCYYSSSDAAFADRYQASEQYSRIKENAIALDGGWRVYSSGAGIALGLIVRRFLGLSAEATALRVDPVIPASLSGLKAALIVYRCPVQVHYVIRATGCGVRRITLNNAELPFDLEANPYRRGAALVSTQQVLQRLTDADNVLTVELD